MDTIRLMLLSLLIGATVSTSPTFTDKGFNLTQTIVLQAGGQVVQPTPMIVYVTPQPTQQPTQRPTARPSATKKIIDTGTMITRELYRGCTGTDVTYLQQLLANLGYNIKPDGEFGASTQNIVLAFQKNNGLKQDGIAGEQTIRKLVSGTAVGPGTTPARTTLYYGMSGQDVKDMQTRLWYLGYYRDTISGNFLDNTLAAVRWFQQNNGLLVTGIADSQTLSRMYGASAVPAGTTPTPSPQPGSFYRNLYMNLSGPDVTLLQQYLVDLNYLNTVPNGFFDTNTYWAVRNFQATNGLTVDGIAGISTYSLLQSGKAKAYPGTTPRVPTPTPPTPTPPTPTPPTPVAPTPTPTPTPTPETCAHCNQPKVAGSTIHDHQLGCGHYECVAGDHVKCTFCDAWMCNPNMPATCSDENPAGIDGGHSFAL